MRKATFDPLAALTGLMLVGAPFVVARAPTIDDGHGAGKIFYFRPSWFAIFTASDHGVAARSTC
jgi:hypothetical protein